MAPDPRTRLNVSVRIAAHAITACAFATVANAHPTNSRDLLEAWVPAHSAEVARESGLLLDHGARDGQIRVLGTEDHFGVLAQRGVFAMTSAQPPPPASGYRMPEQGDAVLEGLAGSAPRAGRTLLGDSVLGRPIWALWLGQAPGSGAPAHRVLAAHHGDEWSSFELALALAETLAAGDGVEPDITATLDQATVWVVPYVNPDGVVYGNRFNANGVDLNRNYDFEWSADSFAPGPVPFSEPESRAVRTFATWVQPFQSLSLHSGATNLGWVWNWTTDPAPDAGLLAEIAGHHADLTSEPDFWTTNGAAWYITNGDTNDWAYGRLGQWDFTLELTAVKAPDPDEIDTFIQNHLGAILDFVSALPDLSGTVTDAQTGAPLPASVVVVREDGTEGQPFRTDPQTGRFHHRAGLEAVRVRVSAPGYDSQELDLEADLTVDLTPRGLDGRPLHPSATTGALQLPDKVDLGVILSQPGHTDAYALTREGEALSDLSLLEGGAWTVTRTDGLIHPRAWLVSDASWAGDVTHTIPEGSAERSARLEGTPLAEGLRVWALYGDDRAQRPLAVEWEGNGVNIDLTGIPEVEPVDLWILNRGQHMFVQNINENGGKTVTPPAAEPRDPAGGCACSVKTGHFHAHAGSVLVCLLLLRRRRC